MKLSPVVVRRPRLRAVAVCVSHTRSEMLWAPPRQWVKARASMGWYFEIRCTEEINGIARGLLIPFKRRNILSPKRMRKKLEQLHLYREPLHQREQGRGVGNVVEGTGQRVPILCSRLNSLKTGAGENDYQYFSQIRLLTNVGISRGAVFQYHNDAEYVEAGCSDMIQCCSCTALFVYTKRAGSLQHPVLAEQRCSKREWK